MNLAPAMLAAIDSLGTTSPSPATGLGAFAATEQGGMLFFGPKVQRQTLASIEANRERLQSWYDREERPRTGGTLDGRKVPEHLLMWRQTTRDLVAGKPWGVTLVYWPTGKVEGRELALATLVAIATAASPPSQPAGCLQCGADQASTPRSVEQSTIHNVVSGSSYFQMPSTTVFRCMLCEACAGGKSLRAELRFHANGPFLTQFVYEFRTRKALVRFLDANADRVVPTFDIKTWQQVGTAELRRLL